jgi:hypothetical protein
MFWKFWKPKFQKIAIIDRAATLIGEFSEGNSGQKNNIADGLLHCVSQTAKRGGVSKFLDPFDNNDRAKITLLRDIAIAGSDKFASDSTSNGMLACCAYAAVASICAARLGDYSHDAEAKTVAELATKLYASSNIARET